MRDCAQDKVIGTLEHRVNDLRTESKEKDKMRALLQERLEDSRQQIQQQQREWEQWRQQNLIEMDTLMSEFEQLRQELVRADLLSTNLQKETELAREYAAQCDDAAEAAAAAANHVLKLLTKAGERALRMSTERHEWLRLGEKIQALNSSAQEDSGDPERSLMQDLADAQAQISFMQDQLDSKERVLLASDHQIHQLRGEFSKQSMQRCCKTANFLYSAFSGFLTKAASYIFVLTVSIRVLEAEKERLQHREERRHRDDEALSREVAGLEHMAASLQHSLGNCSAAVWQHLARCQVEDMLQQLLQISQSKAAKNKRIFDDAQVCCEFTIGAMFFYAQRNA